MTLGLAWFDLACWFDVLCIGFACFGRALACFRSVSLALVGFHLGVLCVDLAWLGSVSCGFVGLGFACLVVWPSFAWSGLVGLGLVCLGLAVLCDRKIWCDVDASSNMPLAYRIPIPIFLRTLSIAGKVPLLLRVHRYGTW